MPKALHQKLKRQAHKLKTKGKLKDVNAYVYGTMAKIKKAHKRKQTRRKKS